MFCGDFFLRVKKNKKIISFPTNIISILSNKVLDGILMMTIFRLYVLTKLRASSRGNT